MKGIIEKLRSVDPARVRLERLERLQGLTAALSAAATPGEVAAIIFDRGLGLVGASAVTLFWEVAPDRLELVHGLGLSEEFVARYAMLPADAGLPSAEAYRTGEPVWLRSPEEIKARFPEMEALARAEGHRAWAALPLVADRSRGALGLRFETPRAFDVEERDFVVAVARQCAQALERARLFEAQTRLAERLKGLQVLTGELSAALTPAEVAAILFRGLIGVGARDAGIFYRSGPDRVDLVHSHSDDAGTVGRLAHRSIDDRSPVTDVVRTGELCWLETPDAIRAAYPGLEGDRARRGDGAWVAVPLRLEGRVVGALAFALPEGRPPREGDRSYVLALAEQCAQALERARLFDSQRRLAERLSQLHSTAAALSGAETPRGVAETAFRGLAALGACSAEIHALEGHDRLVLLAQHGLPGVPADPVLALDAPVPAAEVVRTGKGIWLESPEEIAARYPYLEPDRTRRGEAAWAVVPLLAGGNALGALAIGFPAPRRFDAEEKAFVRMLAGPCAQALERARLSEAAARHRGEAARDSAVLDALFGGALVGIALLDRELRFQRVNPFLARMNGIPADAHLGKTPRELLPGLPADQIESAARRVVETGAPVEGVAVVGELPAAPGATKRFVGSFFPVRVGRELVGVGVVVREVPLGG